MHLRVLNIGILLVTDAMSNALGKDNSTYPVGRIKSNGKKGSVCSIPKFFFLKEPFLSVNACAEISALEFGTKDKDSNIFRQRATG